MSSSRLVDLGRLVLRAAGPPVFTLLVACLCLPGRADASAASGFHLFNAAPVGLSDSVGASAVGISAPSFSSVTYQAGSEANPAVVAAPDVMRRIAAVNSTGFGSSSRADSFVSDAVFTGALPAPLEDSNIAAVSATSDSVAGSISGLAFQIDSEGSAPLRTVAGMPVIGDAAELPYGPTQAAFAFENMPAARGVSVGQQLDTIALGDPNGAPLLSGTGDISLQTSAFSPLTDGSSHQASFAPSTRGPAVQLNLPLTLGNVDARLSLTGRSVRESSSTGLIASPFSAPADSALTSQVEQLHGGVTVGVPIFKRQAEVSLDGVFSRLINDPSQSFTNDSAPPPALGLYGSSNAPATSALSGLSAYQNLATGRQYVGAYSVALPIGKALTANMQYVDQRFGGDPLSSVNTGLNLEKTTSTFGVLYKIPNTNAAINLNFNQSTYENDQLPGYNWVQNRQNLFFTVKF